MGPAGHRVTSRIAEKYRTIAMKGTVEEWATESLLAARAAYVVPGTEARIKSGQKLAKSYQDAQLAGYSPTAVSVGSEAGDGA